MGLGEVSHISRKSYLAEMRSLLAFMDPDDRVRVLRHFDAMFDEAGAEGEETLTRCLGSPVRQVLQIEREYREAKEKGEEFYPETAVPVPAPAPQPEKTLPPTAERPISTPEKPAAAPAAAQPEPKAGAGEEAHPADELESALVAVFEQEPEKIVPGEAGEAPKATEGAAPEESRDVPAAAPEAPPESEENADGKEEGPGAGRVVAAILVTIPMLVVWAAMLAVFLALGAAVLAVGVGFGAAGVYLGSYVFSGVITFMPDMMLVAGAALVCFALALLFAWAGLWIAIGGIILTVRFARSVYRGILGKKKGEVKVDE